VIRSSAFAVFLFASSAALGQAWHGPYVPEREAAPKAAPANPAPQPPHRALRDTPHVWLAQMIGLKFHNAAYAAALATRGRIPSSAHMAEEQWVRQARSEIAKLRRAPQDVRVLVIPRAKRAPSLDGRIYTEEWAGALRIPLEPAAGGAAVLLLAHGGQLYLAALAPKDDTESGFDQFRFWFHIDLSPYLRSERVFLAGKGWFAQLREAPKPPDDMPLVEAPDPRKLKQRSDWNIFDRTRGASRVDGFRQYELAVDMNETGLFAGVPFPAFFEIEGDPVLDAGRKFKARTILGTGGSAAAPLWLRVTP